MVHTSNLLYGIQSYILATAFSGSDIKTQIASDIIQFHKITCKQCRKTPAKESHSLLLCFSLCLSGIFSMQPFFPPLA